MCSVIDLLILVFIADESGFSSVYFLVSADHTIERFGSVFDGSCAFLFLSLSLSYTLAVFE